MRSLSQPRRDSNVARPADKVVSGPFAVGTDTDAVPDTPTSVVTRRSSASMLMAERAAATVTNPAPPPEAVPLAQPLAATAEEPEIPAVADANSSTVTAAGPPAASLPTANGVNVHRSLRRSLSSRTQHVHALRDNDDDDDDEDDDVVLALRGLRVSKSTAPVSDPAPAPRTPSPTLAVPPMVPDTIPRTMLQPARSGMLLGRGSQHNSRDWSKHSDSDEDEELVEGAFNPMADDLDADFTNPLLEA